MKTKILSLCGFLLGAMPDCARACAVCYGDGQDAVSAAFNWSLLFLMAAPYLVFGSIVGCLVYFYRRASGGRAEGEPELDLTLRQEESTQ